MLIRWFEIKIFSFVSGGIIAVENVKSFPSVLLVLEAIVGGFFDWEIGKFINCKSDFWSWEGKIDKPLGMMLSWIRFCEIGIVWGRFEYSSLNVRFDFRYLKSNREINWESAVVSWQFCIYFRE